MVEVLHDGKGLGAAWLIECIIVERQGVSWVFPCGKWMQADDYSNIDHLVHKVLPCKSRIEDAHSNLTNIKVPRLSEPSHNYVNKTNDLGRRGRSFNLIGGWNSIPHPDKAKLGLLGEDACFVLPNDRYPDVAALGVADGVGDWIKKGVDSGVFARMLMASTRLAVTEEFTSDPVKILDRSWSHMKGIPGSSTVCLALLDKKEGVLRIANLGDSGFILIRNGRSLMRSTPQEHFWGHPYQLSSLNKDQPSDCESYSAQVKKGDIIVLASDGVFDNMFDEEICEIVWRGRFVACHQIASYLAEVAHAKSMSKTEETPFAQVAAEELNMVVNGGKKDDITVVIGKIVYDIEDATHASE
jgi:protein phosphatase PTC7